MYRILLTGSDGYIGSHLRPYLESRGMVVDCYQGEICDFDIDPDRMPDMVIHLAALTGVRKSIEMPDEYYRVNVMGTREVYAACVEHDVPLIFASSSNAKEVNNPYAETKWINECDRIPNSVGIRPHTVYPGRPDMLYQSLLRGDVTYVNGAHRRDFTHIDDMCSAIFTIIQNYGKLVGKVIDVGTGHSVSVLDVARALGFDGEVRRTPTHNERTVTEADITELLNLGWTPKKDILNEIRNLK